jgi:hypothetical protein
MMAQMRKPQSVQEIVDAIEQSLEREGLIRDPEPRYCWECGKATDYSGEYEGAFVVGCFCSECWPEADRMECILGEPGRTVQHQVRLGLWRYVYFLSGAEVWLITPTAPERLPYFRFYDYTDDALVEKIRIYLTFL